MTMKQLGFPENFADSTGRALALDRQGRVLPDAGRLPVFSERTEARLARSSTSTAKCNRVAATLFGPKRCIFVCGVNKLRPDLQSAIERAEILPLRSMPSG